MGDRLYYLVLIIVVVGLYIRFRHIVIPVLAVFWTCQIFYGLFELVVYGTWGRFLGWLFFGGMFGLGTATIFPIPIEMADKRRDENTW